MTDQERTRARLMLWLFLLTDLLAFAIWGLKGLVVSATPTAILAWHLWSKR